MAKQRIALILPEDVMAYLEAQPDITAVVTEAVRVRMNRPRLAHLHTGQGFEVTEDGAARWRDRLAVSLPSAAWDRATRLRAEFDIRQVSDPDVVILDASALIRYGYGAPESLAVAELVAAVESAGRRVALSAWALTVAMADPGIGHPAVLEWFLDDAAQALVVGLALEDIPVVARLAHDFTISPPTAHTVMLALRREAAVAATQQNQLRLVLGEDWPILDVS